MQMLDWFSFEEPLENFHSVFLLTEASFFFFLAHAVNQPSLDPEWIRRNERMNSPRTGPAFPDSKRMITLQTLDVFNIFPLEKTVSWCYLKLVHVPK
jgi:hypothetical protein